MSSPAVLPAPHWLPAVSAATPPAIQRAGAWGRGRSAGGNGVQGECKGKQPKPRGTAMRMGIHLGLHDSCVDTPSPNSGTPRWHRAGPLGEGAPSWQLRFGRDAERAAGRDCHRHKENAHGHLDSVLRDAVCVLDPWHAAKYAAADGVRSARWMDEGKACFMLRGGRHGKWTRDLPDPGPRVHHTVGIRLLLRCRARTVNFSSGRPRWR